MIFIKEIYWEDPKKVQYEELQADPDITGKSKTHQEYAWRKRNRCDCDEKYSIQGALGSLIYINCK